MDWWKSILVGVTALCLAACGQEAQEADEKKAEKPAPKKQTVVVYTAHDQIYSEPIFRDFEEKTGIRVQPVFDTEAAKTVGLVNRIVAEKANPRCDVFWNNEIARTLHLKREGLLQPYRSPRAEAYPAFFRDPENQWTGLAGRARILIVNTEKVPDYLSITPSIFTLTEPRFKGRVAIAKPLFGTTSTHAALLFAQWGPEKAKAWFDALKANDIIVAAGNGQVRDLVATGQADIGLTDTDDANGAIEDGYPVAILYPDSPQDKTVVIPNTVALIAGAPHPEAGQALIDYLLSAEVEKKLSAGRAAQIPLAQGVAGAGKTPPLSELAVAEVDWQKVTDALPRAMAYIETEFLAAP